MLPMVAGALPVLVTVSPPCTVKVVGPEELSGGDSPCDRSNAVFHGIASDRLT